MIPFFIFWHKIHITQGYTPLLYTICRPIYWYRCIQFLLHGMLITHKWLKMLNVSIQIQLYAQPHLPQSAVKDMYRQNENRKSAPTWLSAWNVILCFSVHTALLEAITAINRVRRHVWCMVLWEAQREPTAVFGSISPERKGVFLSTAWPLPPYISMSRGRAR